MRKILVLAIAFLVLAASMSAESKPLSTLKLGGGISYLSLGVDGDLPFFYETFVGTALGAEVDWLPLKTGAFGFGIATGLSSSIVGVLQIPLELLCILEVSKGLGISLNAGYVLMAPLATADVPPYHHAAATLGIEFKGFYLRAGAAYFIDAAGALALGEALRLRAQCGYFFFMK